MTPAEKSKAWRTRNEAKRRAYEVERYRQKVAQKPPDEDITEQEENQFGNREAAIEARIERRDQAARYLLSQSTEERQCALKALLAVAKAIQEKPIVGLLIGPGSREFELIVSALGCLFHCSPEQARQLVTGEKTS